MRTGSLLLATALLTGGALSTPAFAAPPEPAAPLPTLEVDACGSTLLIEELRSNARESFRETENGIKVFTRGNATLRVTDLETDKSVDIKAPGRARLLGTFDPEGMSGTLRFDLAGINVLLPEPYIESIEAEAQKAFGLPEFAIVHGRYVAEISGNEEGPTSARVIRAGNRVVNVCDLLR